LHQLRAVRTRDNDCDACVSVDVPAGSSIIVAATATLLRFADGSLLFPEDRSFPDGATVDVAFQP